MVSNMPPVNMWTSSRGMDSQLARRIGNPYENAIMESFFKILKHEEVNPCEYGTFQDVVVRPPYFLEEVYNLKRLHSALGYRPPNKFEEALLNQENNESPPPDSPNPTCPIIGVHPTNLETVQVHTRL
jgi:hypothetical protein